MTSAPPPSVFISYAHEDKELARALAGALELRGLHVWIDEGELKVGNSIIERIATAIAEIDFFLALVSEASRTSNWCRKELALAVTGELGREGVKVLPIRVDLVPLPDSLKDVYYLDLNRESVKDVARKIANAIPEHQKDQRKRIADRREAARSAAVPSTGTTVGSTPTPANDEPIQYRRDRLGRCRKAPQRRHT